MLSATSVAPVITGGIGDLGSGLLVIFGAVITLFVGVYLFRKGLAWLRHSGR